MTAKVYDFHTGKLQRDLEDAKLNFERLAEIVRDTKERAQKAKAHAETAEEAVADAMREVKQAAQVVFGIEQQIERSATK